MIFAPIPENEPDRIHALKSYHILDTLPEQDFDDLTTIASQICQVPIALISLVDTDRQWFKSKVGLEADQTPRDISFCGHAIQHPNKAFIIPDSREDLRFFDNPLVIDRPHVIFYAGIPLVNPEGHTLGTLCVVDHEARHLTHSQVETLEALGRQVVSQLELRKNVQQLQVAHNHIEILHQDLSEIAYRVSHDLKTPSRGIRTLTDWLITEHYESLDANGREYLDLLLAKSQRLQKLLDGFIRYCKTTTVFTTQNQEIIFPDFWEELHPMFEIPAGFDISYPQTHHRLVQYKLGLLLIFEHLITNAIQHCTHPNGKVVITIAEEAHHFCFRVIDNGPGIPHSYRKKVFNLFEKLTPQDQEKSGIGLALVKSIVHRMHGKIEIIDLPDKQPGACFEFRLKKNP